MTRQHASVAVLGACAVAAAMLLAQPAPWVRQAAARATPSPRATRAPEPSVARTQAALVRIRGTTTGPPTATLALCYDCAASHALVRVMRRRNRSGLRTTPTLVLVDKRWPALDTLLYESPESRVLVIPNLTAQVRITPVALPALTDSSAAPGAHALVVGVPEVAALLTPVPPGHDRIRPH